MSGPFAPSPLLVTLLGCGGVQGPLPLLDGEGFFDRPWPSDLRRGTDGHPDLTGFPERGSIPLLDTYASYAESLEGFGNNGPIYVRFDGPVDTDLLPNPEESAEMDAALLLIDVDRRSLRQGEIVPVEWSFETEETRFRPADVLAVRPVYGFPLRPATTYALLVREPVAAVGERMRAVWDPSNADREVWSGVAETLFPLGIDLETIAAATVFTTQDPVGELEEYAAVVHDRLDLPDLGDPTTLISDRGSYLLYEGWTFAPLFQEGERPYTTSGGGLHRDADGQPVPWAWEWIRFAVSIPVVSGTSEGVPLCITSHGTGGDYLSFADDQHGFGIAQLLAERGIAGLAIDQPLHGLRAPPGIDPEFYTFNPLNPDAARGTLRQGALDHVFLAAALARSPSLSIPGGYVRIDPSRITFLGHSQGGITGALAAPFVGREVQALFLSGAGGGLTLSILHREAGLDLATLLPPLLGMDEDETLDTFHPALALVQWLSDVTDPLSYAPFWFAEAPPWDTAPVSVALSEGLLDPYTPSLTTEAMAAAGRVPIVEPAATWPLAHHLRGLQVESTPVCGNATGHDGAAVTAGLLQYPADGHFAIFENATAAQTWADFLASASEDGPPTLGPSHVRKTR